MEWSEIPAVFFLTKERKIKDGIKSRVLKAFAWNDPMLCLQVH